MKLHLPDQSSAGSLLAAWKEEGGDKADRALVEAVDFSNMVRLGPGSASV